jgi:23S rRNA (cytosine1962-C5)-methyltransferase
MFPVQLHPASYRHLSQGHPWVLKDSYTEKFRAKERLLLAVDKKSRKSFILLTDTAHPKIKARLWDTLEGDVPEHYDFISILKKRIQSSLAKREKFITQREDLFLTFGEADFLPGLFIMKLGEGLIIQSYARYWKKFQKDLIPILRELLQDSPYAVSFIAWQERDDSKKTPLVPVWGKMPEEITVREFDIHYKVKLTQGYDLGLYPDMAAIRESLPFNWKDKKVLNLYSYTGAWSLYPMAKGASEVVSVDLSAKYLEWLEENISLNSFLASHQSLASDTQRALKELLKDGQTFDFILCDPPSFSSDGKKTQTSLKAYQQLLPLIKDLLAPKGEALLFINTHSITRKKFEEQMKIYNSKVGLKKIKSLGLKDDCPLIKNFPEGDYLKGLLYKRI